MVLLKKHDVTLKAFSKYLFIQQISAAVSFGREVSFCNGQWIF